MNPGDLRVLTVRQPQASAIVLGHKDVENRGRQCLVRGWIAIHAGMKTDPHGLPVDVELPDELPHGVIIGVVRVVDCVFDASTSKWAMPDRWHWILEDARPLDVPVPCRGHLPLFHPPADVAAAVLDQLEMK